MSQRTYEIIGYEPEMRMDEILSIPGKGFQGVGNYPKNFGTAAREFDIHRALNAGAIRHLRFPSAPAEPCNTKKRRTNGLARFLTAMF